ncbi:TPA: DUF4238 domain-containing protein [Providencia rettgeri]
MTKARHHHYLSQCYLKGFTQGSAKKSKLAVVELKTKKIFETTPRNVGGIRDFNKIEIAGFDPNYIETNLSAIEGPAASSINKLQENQDFSGETKNNLIMLIAMLGARSPQQRKHIDSQLSEIPKKIMKMMVSSEERYDSVIENSYKTADKSELIDYEKMKEFVNSDNYNVSLTQEFLIELELKMMQEIEVQLQKRNWILIKSTAESGEFITSDKPVNLVWKKPIDNNFHYSPGYGLLETTVYFPITKNLALLGTFDDLQNQSNFLLSDATKEFVANLNTLVIHNCYDYIYTSGTKNFFYYSKNNQMELGSRILK